MPRDDMGAARGATGCFVLFVSCWALASCGAGSHDLGDDGGPSTDDGGVDHGADAALDAGRDAGVDFDCQAACARDPPLCTPPRSDNMPCEEECRLIRVAPGCVLGENLRLLECYEQHPGACEQKFEGGPCAEEWDCYWRCSWDGSVICRPPRE